MQLKKKMDLQNESKLMHEIEQLEISANNATLIEALDAKKKTLSESEKRN